MNIKIQSNLSMGIGNNPFVIGGMLKSTQEKIARQNQRDSQIAFFEQQKEQLKNIKADDLEGISRKLDMLHSYEDQIAAAKAAYNQEQMRHVMDEAMERAEKMAEAAEKMEPKTPEEREKEMVEEALGIDEIKGELSESLDELVELTEELAEDITEKMTEDITGKLTEELSEENLEELAAETGEAEAAGALPEEDRMPDGQRYRRIDYYI
ncbi:MAG: hypothetical protein K2O73_06295 [Lachnospiraceae bacterium]|nr:hypothetical protein [Lachnospiraceae bacterium]